ncbi:hypothetical protein BV22DRAFT_1082424 [Leucogyrophana mollusca]|uniref:Uncharacterized protein n=1 Tax=Leucogyrophana mollusca TaxID=85980 RepID=A0ACB8BVN4_9AGAM|nr:hypothetical protein BV22DRAFT_1082424 [Leucogyrophana mollusca]
MSFFGRLRKVRSLGSFAAHLGKRNASSIPSIPLAELKPPFYEVKKAPDLLVRLTYPFIFADIVWTLGGLDLIWNRWTRPVESNEGNISEETQYELRPWWQRAFLGTMHVGFGCAWAYLVFTSSARNIRKLWILPRRLLPQSTSFAGHHAVIAEGFRSFRKQGRMYDLKDCYLSAAKRSDDLILNIGRPGERGGALFIATSGAIINGKPTSREESREAIMKKFGVRSGAP